jgi:hypothetical protein
MRPSRWRHILCCGPWHIVMFTPHGDTFGGESWKGLGTVRRRATICQGKKKWRSLCSILLRISRDVWCGCGNGRGSLQPPPGSPSASACDRSSRRFRTTVVRATIDDAGQIVFFNWFPSSSCRCTRLRSMGLTDGDQFVYDESLNRKARDRLDLVRWRRCRWRIIPTAIQYIHVLMYTPQAGGRKWQGMNACPVDPLYSASSRASSHDRCWYGRVDASDTMGQGQCTAAAVPARVDPMEGSREMYQPSINGQRLEVERGGKRRATRLSSCVTRRN